MTETIAVAERGHVLEFSFEDMLRYAGPHSPGGVAHAFKALQRAIEVLSPDAAPQRRSIAVRTPFQGPGARDGFEAVTRAVTGGPYTVDTALARPDLGRLRQSFVFEVSVGDRAVTLLLREGFVSAEFIDLAGTSQRTEAEESRLDELKAQLADRVMAAPARDVYDVAN